MDQEYCKATPAGGLVLANVVKRRHFKSTQRYGIDSNPEAGYFCVGSHQDNNICSICEAYIFPTLASLTEFVRCNCEIYPIEVKLNGVGSVVRQHLIEKDLSTIGTWVTEDIKNERVTNASCMTTIVPPEFQCPLPAFQQYVADADDVIAILTKQIWGPDKKIVKFSDAHWFDAYYLSIANGQEEELDFGELQAQARYH